MNVSTEASLERLFKDFETLLTSEPPVSPQLARKLHNLLASNIQDKLNLLRHLISLFNRLLFELVQTHYTTSQREEDFVRLIKSKGCTLPNLTGKSLTDEVIDILVKLFKVADQCTDSSFERKVLIDYLLKELNDNGADKRKVERIFQTLYRTSCFEVGIGKSGRLKLKEHLRNASSLRNNHDEELIKMALTQEVPIRLTPESWVHLLFRPNEFSRIQSILDKHQVPVKVEELRRTITAKGDRYNISRFIPELAKIESELLDLEDNLPMTLDDIVVILDRLQQMIQLFTLRQSRGHQ